MKLSTRIYAFIGWLVVLICGLLMVISTWHDTFGKLFR